jgi:hypothetical protein
MAVVERGIRELTKINAIYLTKHKRKESKCERNINESQTILKQ